jgi:hypothetical protein
MDIGSVVTQRAKESWLNCFINMADFIGTMDGGTFFLALGITLMVGRLAQRESVRLSPRFVEVQTISPFGTYFRCPAVRCKA